MHSKASAMGAARSPFDGMIDRACGLPDGVPARPAFPRHRLAVGQQWVCYAAEAPHLVWRFELIHRLTYAGQVYFVGLKLDVEPDSAQVVVFTEHGAATEGSIGFYCVRPVRRRRPPSVRPR